MAVRAVADGKEAARSIAQYLTGKEAVGPEKRFNSRMGKLSDSEMPVFLESASPDDRIKPFGIASTFSIDEAKAESLRCLRCDCRKPEDCLLRRYAETYGARQNRYKSDRRLFVQRTQHPDVIYEPGKCIDCGICIEIATEAGEDLGLTFVGRGFDVRVAVPFEETLADGLRKAAERCVASCPTGALAFKDGREPSAAPEREAES